MTNSSSSLNEGRDVFVMVKKPILTYLNSSTGLAYCPALTVFVINNVMIPSNMFICVERISFQK